MKPVSKKLNFWADFFVAVGHVMIIISIIVWLFGDNVIAPLSVGIFLYVSSIFLRGFSVLVKHAEKQNEIWDNLDKKIGDN